MQNKVLEVKDLTKQFGDFTAVDHVSFSLKEGEILGLLGPNGAGKTTTIQILLDVMDPTGGEISYFGKSFKDHRSEILKKINFSSAYINVPKLFKVEEVLNFFAYLYEVPDRKKRINKLLKEFEIDHLRNKSVNTLSAGERARLLLTKAFLNYPEIILLDEPTSSLDPEIAVKIREFLKTERKEYNVSILITSHNMQEIEEMCDWVVFLNHGKVIAENSPENLVKASAETKLELLIKDKNSKFEKILKDKKMEFENEKFVYKINIAENNIANFLTILAREEIEYQDIDIIKPDLEDYFLGIAGGNKHD